MAITEKFIFLGLLTGLLIYAGVIEERSWQAFKADHDCKIVGKISGSTGWLCDDGMTYWR